MLRGPAEGRAGEESRCPVAHGRLSEYDGSCIFELLDKESVRFGNVVFTCLAAECGCNPGRFNLVLDQNWNAKERSALILRGFLQSCQSSNLDDTYIRDRYSCSILCE